MCIEKFGKGSIRDLEKIYRLYVECKNDLLEKDILQWGNWNGDYPNIKHLRQAIIQKELFILMLGKNIIGAVILNEKQSDRWKTMPWSKTKGKVLVLHALIIDPKNQGRGFGKKLLTYCEQHAHDNNYGSIRLDSFKKNKIANKFYRKFGYLNVGTVIFDQKPEGNREYNCYEKLL